MFILKEKLKTAEIAGTQLSCLEELRRFEPTNLRRVSSLKVGDQVEVHGITGTLRSLNGCTLYIHRWDGAQVSANGLLSH